MLLQQKLGAFVWSKMGSEAGESLNDIICRKEMERRANGGKFVWGIGNSLRDSITSFMKEHPGQRMAVFTPMKNKAKPHDKNPPRVVVWRDKKLPEHSFVTSRFTGGNHYALLCECNEDLGKQSHGKLHKDRLVNYLKKEGKHKQVGSSQVTAVVKTGKGAGGDYSICFAASLYGEGWMTLSDPAKIFDKKEFEEVKAEVQRTAVDGNVEKWQKLIGEIKGG